MKPVIQFPDFEKVELRVGKIVDAIVPDWSQKLIQETVDFGAEIGIRTIFSGIKKWYKPEDLIGKKFIFVVNLVEKKMGDSLSQGMMVMAVNPDDVLTLIPVDDNISEGTEVR